eukprot:4218358-Prymnesium_polylepis.1
MCGIGRGCHGHPIEWRGPTRVHMSSVEWKESCGVDAFGQRCHADAESDRGAASRGVRKGVIKA